MNQKTVPVPSALAAAAIIALYTLLSLFRLGYSYAPGTCWQAAGQGEEILLDLGKTQDVGSLSWYLGNYEKRVFELYVGNGVPLTWVRLPDVEMKRVWQWEGSLVNMGVKNADSSVCYIIGVRKDIQAKIGKGPGDIVDVTVQERQ